ncbi:hypothetical protein ACQJBY_032717 [Aegilops geniculata]
MLLQHFKGLSFPTISSVGPNAAIIHYSPEANTCAELDADKIYLCDSGAQYLDGTTDITRTVHFGKPSEHQISCYTAVLKGHIALDAAVFPNGTTGESFFHCSYDVNSCAFSRNLCICIALCRQSFCRENYQNIAKV